MSSAQVDNVAKTLRSIPDAPGVYIMKGEKGRVLYVGKAKRLSGRVRSYFQKQEALAVKTRALVARVASIDYILRQNCAAANLPRINAHALRHTAASLAIDGGMPLHRVRDLLGHSSVLVTSRYLHTLPLGTATCARNPLS